MELSSNQLRGLLLVGSLLIGAGIYFFSQLGEQSTDDAGIEAHVITISPKVAGYIQKIQVTDNQFVKAGDVLFEIDPTDYQLRRNRAQAALEAAEAAYRSAGSSLETTKVSAPSTVDQAKAQLEANEANWHKALQELERLQKLNSEARSQQQLEEAIASEKMAFSAVQEAKAHLKTAHTAPQVIAEAKATTDQLAAQVKQAEAELASAEKDLSDTRILAPIDGTVIKPGIQPGNYVQSGQAVGSLVGTELWVIANFKETQLTKMRKGQSVSISIDAFPKAKIKGQVDSIQIGTGARFSLFPPENATGNYVKVVQRVPVKIVFTRLDPSLPIGPGMSVVPVVHTR